MKAIERVRIAVFTHTGLYRRRNEDSLLFRDRVIAGISMGNPETHIIDSFPVILAVADGLGGAVAGDVASREVLHCLADAPAPGNEPALLSTIIRASDHLNQLARRDQAMEGLGTTLAGVLIAPHELVIFSCGDSRVYSSLPERNSLHLITKDHSIIQEMIDSGSLSEDEARKHPLGHVITSCLSGGRNSRRPDIRRYAIVPQPGYRMIICTDGVWDYGGEEFIKASLIQDTDHAAREIVKACFQAAAPDNVTFIIADME